MQKPGAAPQSDTTASRHPCESNPDATSGRAAKRLQNGCLTKEPPERGGEPAHFGGSASDLGDIAESRTGAATTEGAHAGRAGVLRPSRAANDRRPRPGAADG